MFYLKLALYVFSAVGIPKVVCAQWTMSEVVSRVSQEKAKVVSFRVIIHQVPQSGKKFERCTWILEQSDLGDHRVGAILRKNHLGGITAWGVAGRSDNIVINGASDDKIIAARKLHPELDKDYAPPKCLDWRIIGMGFCGDIGSSYEEVAKYVSEWDKSVPPKFDLSKKERILIERDTSSPPVAIELEQLEGLRFLKFTLGYDPETYPNFDRKNFSQWNVRYEQVFGLRLPVEASLLCGEKDVVHYELDWKMVNDPVELGIPTGKRFEELIEDSKFVDKTKD